MCNRDKKMRRLNELVEDYQSVLRSTVAGSVEREQAGRVYTSILELVAHCSDRSFNLNQIKPATLHFLEHRGLNISTLRVGGTSRRKKSQKRENGWAGIYLSEIFSEMRVTFFLFCY